MKTTYATFGTCARFIDIELDGETIVSVTFIGGCKGNAQGISALVKGMTISDVAERLAGISCRGTTSCPDQLAQALHQLRLAAAS